MTTARGAATMASLVCLLIASAATARTPTPSATEVPTPEPPTVLLHGHVYDGSQGPEVPVPGARIAYTRWPGVVEGVFSADLDGNFTILVSQRDTFVNIAISAAGFQTSFLSQPPDVSRTIDVALQPQERSTTVTVAVYDPAYSLPQPVSGATIEYTFVWRGGGAEQGSVVTNDMGVATFALPIDVDWVTIRVSHEFYVPFLITYTGDDLRDRRFVPVEVRYLSTLENAVHGIVYDASAGPDRPIAGAEIHWERYSGVLEHDEGTVRSAADGGYNFDVDLAEQTWVDITVTAPGFAPRTATIGSLYRPEVIDFALAPAGGAIAVSPNEPYFVVQCAGRFDVTIANTAAPGDLLTIVDVTLHHGYSQGEYGTGFAWDLSAIHLPLQLDGGESLSFPVTYMAQSGDFDSRLHVDVKSGARDGTPGIVVHGRAGAPNGYPYDIVCGDVSPTPTPTPTPPFDPCAGDCNGDRRVTVDELIRLVRMALRGSTSSDPRCIGFDFGPSISVNEIIVAVNNALGNC